MTDVYIVTLSITGMLISYPGLAVALNLLLPNTTRRAYHCLADTPIRTFFLGLVVTGFFVFWIAFATQSNAGPIKALGFVVALIGMGVASIGAAALARLIGKRIGQLTGSSSELGSMVRGAVVYELACIVPVVGWFLFFPLTSLMIMGAASLSLLGWSPQKAPDLLVSKDSGYKDGNIEE